MGSICWKQVQLGREQERYWLTVICHQSAVGHPESRPLPERPVLKTKKENMFVCGLQYKVYTRECAEPKGRAIKTVTGEVWG